MASAKFKELSSRIDQVVDLFERRVLNVPEVAVVVVGCDESHEEAKQRHFAFHPLDARAKLTVFLRRFFITGAAVAAAMANSRG